MCNGLSRYKSYPYRRKTNPHRHCPYTNRFRLCRCYKRQRSHVLPSGQPRWVKRGSYIYMYRLHPDSYRSDAIQFRCLQKKAYNMNNQCCARRQSSPLRTSTIYRGSMRLYSVHSPLRILLSLLQEHKHTCMQLQSFLCPKPCRYTYRSRLLLYLNMLLSNRSSLSRTRYRCSLLCRLKLYRCPYLR